VLPGKKFTPEDILAILRKRKWLIVAPFVVGVAVSLFVAKRIPQQYRSETLIMVVPQRIPDSYVKPTDTTTIEERLPSISEQIQSRSRLERIINEFDLYRKERAEGVMEDVVQKMRANIAVKLEGKTQDSSFRISYVNADPGVAQKVTQRLASWYIEENLRDRENLATNTSDFLNSELEDAKRRLLEHEKKLEAYKQRYSGQLPTQLESNLQAIQSTQMQLQALNETINRARERRLLIERQLADAQITPEIVAPVAPAPGTPDASPQLSTAQQLELAETTLERYKLRYTADHPDVRALERTIRDLRTRLAAEPAPSTQSASVKPMSTAELARQKRIKDLQAELDVIDRQIASGEQDQKALTARMADYQGKADAAPAREAELVELTRDYATLQATYTSLLTKREDSKLAANLERRQIGEQFKVLDPPSLPERPEKPMMRLMVIAGGSGGGLVLGLLCVGFLEYRDTSFKTEADITSVLALPVLALIPVMISDDERQAEEGKRRRRAWASVVTAVVVLGSVAIVAFWRLQH
jgi:polysaccharide chain length determinant protein (PEP-CTERM system associated)